MKRDITMLTSSKQGYTNMNQTGAPWQILALRYSENKKRTRRDSFIFASKPDAPHTMDFFFWVLRRGEEVIVVDTGMDTAEAARRDRPILHAPVDMLASIGIDPADVKTLIITHLHFDHAGCIDAFPNATIHIQAEELSFATGAMMTNDALRLPYALDPITTIVTRLHKGDVVVHDGECAIAQGVTGHLLGGHSAGLMALTVQTRRGKLLLASDVAHYYESVTKGLVFLIVVDAAKMVHGYNWLREHAEGDISRILPAHDPLIRRVYPEVAPDIFDLSAAPDHQLLDELGSS
ncbi:N-acyl homoserine lactonase family protein [Celeribacter sp.]|uniref:N-acyl homoserine lactonase family protein n=1 Tax=Celeribacter sp. TaxID=1890673 RepID=UPI003A9155FB